MQTFQWQDNDLEFEKENVHSRSHSVGTTGMTGKETKESIQLKKYRDPTKDEHRQAQLALLNKFGALFESGNFQGIAKELLTEDFEIFIFNSSGKTSAKNAHRPQGFIDMFKDAKIFERRVRETDIDSEKSTACQICTYKIAYKDDSAPIEEIACEIFSIRDGRISKYRASFGNPVLDDPTQDPLTPTKKDKWLAKVKEINYALAGDPDFEKVGTLLGENVEFKIWRWDDRKCFTLRKNDFTTPFKELQENMSITCIVPYEISADGQGRFVTATYVYYLEDNSSGQKYDWFSTCIYRFDNDENIIKVSQQGELYPEGEVDVPYEVHTRETIEKTIHELSSPDDFNFDFSFLADKSFLYDCMIWTICFACPPGARCFQGFKQVQTLIDKQEMFKDTKVQFGMALDIFVDHHNRSHDVVFSLEIAKGKGIGFCKGDDHNEELSTVIILTRGALENGKFAKSWYFLSKVEEPIGSPFDDKSFHCLNIK